MTTIAWDGKMLAADSQMTGSYIDRGAVKKIHKKNGALIAGAGAYAEILLFVNAWPDKPEGLSDQFEALVIQDNTAAWWDNKHQPVPQGTPAAIGSGNQFAMGAMLNGATAKQAVQIAIELDPDTGGKVNTACL